MRGVSLGDELSDEANSDADILPQQSNNNLGVMLDVWCDSDVSPSCSRKPSYDDRKSSYKSDNEIDNPAIAATNRCFSELNLLAEDVLAKRDVMVKKLAENEGNDNVGVGSVGVGGVGIGVSGSVGVGDEDFDIEDDDAGSGLTSSDDSDF